MRVRPVTSVSTWDVVRVGHLRVRKRAAALGDRTVVGVSPDALSLANNLPRMLWVSTTGIVRAASPGS